MSKCGLYAYATRLAADSEVHREMPETTNAPE
jgi:hypothetical protein